MQFIQHIVLWLLNAFTCFSDGKGTSQLVKTDFIPGPVKTEQKVPEKSARILYGQASFYASKFEGRKTANGEIFRHEKLTAACNSLPLGTWIKVTNLQNGKSVVVKTNDRLHPKTKRLVDLTHTAAQKLGFIKSGLTRVKVEVLKQKP
jgi:rare lipoprotein A